jgi:hypothetical protein
MLNPSELLVEPSLKLEPDEIDHWKLVDQLYLWEAAYVMEDLCPSRARKAIDAYHNRESVQPNGSSGLDDGGSPVPHPLGLLRKRIANHKDLLTRAVFSGEIAPITFLGEVHEASISSAELKEWMVKKRIPRSVSLSSGRYPLEEEIDRLKTENQRLSSELEQFQAFMNYEKPLAQAMLGAFDKFWRYPAPRPRNKKIVSAWLTATYSPPEYLLLSEKFADDIAKVLMSAEARKGGRPSSTAVTTG